MYKAVFTIAFVCFFAISGMAQQKPFEYSDSAILMESEPAEEMSDNLTTEEDDNTGDILSDTTLYINLIELSPDTLAAWKKNKRFAYIKNLDSLLQKKQKEDLEKQETENDEQGGSFFQKLLSSNFIQKLFWGFAITVIIFILYKLFLSNGIFKRKPVSMLVHEEPEVHRAATVSDYDKYIHQSCKLGDYRLAVRYLFLKSLVQLAEKEHIQLSADKTNYQYVQEIGPGLKAEFAALVLTYEYTWYGNFPLNQETYTGIEKKYSSFYHKI